MPNRAKLTKRSVEALKPGPEPFFVWDTELKGFGVRVLNSGTKSFVVQYRLKQQQRRLVLGKFPILTADKARDRAKRALADIADGRDPAAEQKEHKGAATVSEMCDAYLAAAHAGLVIGRAGTAKKESTLTIDEGRIERHIKPLLGKLSAREVTSADVEQFKNAVAQGKTSADIKTGPRGRAIVRGGKGTATRTVGLLGGIFEWARAQGLVGHNPVRGVRRFADGRREILYTDDQLALLGAVLRKLEQANDKELRLNKVGIPIIRFIALSGLRRDEARNLRWDEVDLDGGCVRLKASKSVKVRPLGRPARDLLASIERTGEYVFSSTPGSPAYAALPRWWERVKAEAAALSPAGATSIASMMNHGLRHTVAGVADRLGFTEATTKALLGHKGSGVTAGYIHKPIDRVLLGAADEVSGHIAAAMGRPLLT